MTTPAYHGRGGAGNDTSSAKIAGCGLDRHFLTAVVMPGETPEMPGIAE
jgi:hypothetical protein